MKVFIYSVHRDIGQIIQDHLSDKGHLCFTFIKKDDFIQTLKDFKRKPDLLILDYMLFNHDCYNIFSDFGHQGFLIPIVFYNDPCLTHPSRKTHWHALISHLQPYLLDYKAEAYESILCELEELIESQTLKPYISLLQPPKQLPRQFIKDPCTLQYLQENDCDCICKFKKRVNLPNNLYYLLSILQSHQDEPLTLSQIIEIYKADNKSISIDSLRVHLSNLKKTMRNDKDCNFIICRNENRYRFMRLGR